eukprot:PhM_4_TR15637/c0_g1_i1/m.2713
MRQARVAEVDGAVHHVRLGWDHEDVATRRSVVGLMCEKGGESDEWMYELQAAHEASPYRLVNEAFECIAAGMEDLAAELLDQLEQSIGCVDEQHLLPAGVLIGCTALKRWLVCNHRSVKSSSPAAGEICIET